MDPHGSVSRWLAQLKQDEAAAVQHLWERYFRQLVALARRTLAVPPAAADEEDVALSAFDSFCRGVREGRFPRLEDRDDLWQLLVTLTRRKAFNLLKHEHRDKRGGGQVVHASALAGGEGDSVADAFARMVGDEPTPEFAAEVAEECRRLLDALPDAELRSVAVWKMEGYENTEIAARLGKSLATVERKLQLIRKTWLREVEP
jgi:DNA-directed RNA polymerase specialized sigma24 family protein